MSESPDRANLLDEIDGRQDEVLRRLDELDAQVQSVLQTVLKAKEQGHQQEGQ